MTTSRSAALSIVTLASISIGIAASCPRDLRAQEVDASKPTNFYPLLDTSLEYNSRDAGGNLFGIRASLTYPPSDAHTFTVELPLLYNSETEQFGLGDSRLRYFFLPYRNYDKFFGSFGPSIDIFAPTGSFENGLGAGSWSLSPGVMVGLMIADWIQTFPVASYLLGTKPSTDLIPEEEKKVTHGISLQAITPIVFSEVFFMQVTPVWSIGDATNGETSRYIQELTASYALTPTLQLTAFWRGVFADNDHTVRVGLTMFFIRSGS